MAPHGADGNPERCVHPGEQRRPTRLVKFGTKTGQLWQSSHEGVTWRIITSNLPEIWSVEALVID